MALLLAVVVERFVLARQTFPGDVWAAHVGMSHKPWLVFAITRVYQQVGRPLVAVGEVVVMLAWLWRAGGRRAAQGLVVALLASACCGLIKILCGPTPLWQVLAHHVGTNFPSGVVTFMTACGGYLALFAWRRGHRVGPLVLAVAIIGAGPARVVGGQHLISDVLGAYMLGGCWLVVSLVYLAGGFTRAGARPAPDLLALHSWRREHPRAPRVQRPAVASVRVREEGPHSIAISGWEEQAESSPATG